MTTIFEKAQESQGEKLGEKQSEAEKQPLTPELAKQIRKELQKRFTSKSDFYGFYEIGSDYGILIIVAFTIQMVLDSGLPTLLQVIIIGFGMLMSAAALKGLNNLVRLQRERQRNAFKTHLKN